MQPKDSRLKLEVEVANENSLHWQKSLREANERNHVLRKRVRQAEFLFGKLVGGGITAELSNEISDFIRDGWENEAN